MKIIGRRFRVMVTYGTRPNQEYAVVPTRDSAEKLAVVARELGYHDARVEEVDDEGHVNQGAREGQASEARAHGPDRPRREVRDMREKSRKTARW